MTRRFEWTTPKSTPKSAAVWTRSNGERIAVEDLNDYHLRNAIFVTQRRMDTPQARQLWKAMDLQLRQEAERRNLRWV